MTATFPKFTIKEMLEAGVHFGHKEMLWNPKMDPFLYGSRNGVHIIDLQKTVALLFKSLQILKAAGSNRKSKILFVGTKRQASDVVKDDYNNYTKYTPLAKKLSFENRNKFSLNAMTKEFEKILDKYLPEFQQQVDLKLPQLKSTTPKSTSNTKLPTLKKK